MIFWRKDPSSLRRLSKLPSSDSLESQAGEGGVGEHGRESRYEDDDVNSLENVEDDDDDEEERILKQKLEQDKKSELGLEEEGRPLRQHRPMLSNNGDATASTPILSRHQLHYGSSGGSSSSDLQATTGLYSSSHNNYSSIRGSNASVERKTELWLDVGAGILLVFGVFVMIISTTLTLKKMAGYV